MRSLTRSCFLLLLQRRFSLLVPPFLLGTCLPALRSTPFSLQTPALILLSRQGAAFAHLDSFRSHKWVVWTNGSVSFPFGKGGSSIAYLPTALYVALKPLFPFHQAQYDQVFMLKLVPFYKVSAGLDSTNKSTTSFPFSDSCSVLATSFSVLPFHLPQSF